MYQISLKSEKLFVNGRTYGLFRPPLMLLGRLGAADLKSISMLYIHAEVSATIYPVQLVNVIFSATSNWKVIWYKNSAV